MKYNYVSCDTAKNAVAKIISVLNNGKKEVTFFSDCDVAMDVYETYYTGSRAMQLGMQKVDLFCKFNINEKKDGWLLIKGWQNK